MSWLAARTAVPGREHGGGDSEKLGRIRQPSYAGIGSCEASDIGSHHNGTATSQRVHVGLRGGVQPHLAVHGGA
jgi:hypothetical protein